jgi:hypothetical protein|tara:strand:- start:168 stop:341 length:174 start_codon:yes stop_codon:yes gene_type:complete
MDVTMPPPVSYQELIKENINLKKELKELKELRKLDTNNTINGIKYNINPEFPPPMYG